MSASSQLASRLSDDDVCGDCLSVSRQMELTIPDDSAMIFGEPAGVVLTDRGEIVVSYHNIPHTLHIFGEDGVFRRAVGRAGAGPGEFRQISAMVPADDEIWVFDAGNQRVAFFNSDFRERGSARVNGVFDGGVTLADQTVIMNGSLSDLMGRGWPLHRLSQRAGFVDSFGSSDPIYRRDLPHLTKRTVVRGRTDESVIVGHRTQYLLEEWSIDHELVERWVREANWFPAYFSREIPNREIPKEPWFFDSRRDDTGRIWTLINHGAADWTEHWDARAVSLDNIQPILEPAFNDSRIEVLDLDDRKVIATVYLEEFFVGFLRDGRVVSYELSEEGQPRIQVWEVSLRAAPDSGR